MIIRKALPSDAEAISHLSVQLGYPANSEVMTRRLFRLGERDDHLVLVAVIDQTVGAWIHAHAYDILESGHVVEITGLIVSENFRRHGVGRSLANRVEEWAAHTGAEAIIVRSNIKRVESHHFYTALGFQSPKTQTVYWKSLSEANSSAAISR